MAEEPDCEALPYYREVASLSLSSEKFSWRELTVRGHADLQEGSGEAKDGTSLAGGFHYRESAIISSPCRNRFILWYHHDDTLSFLEVSLDTNLAHNALRLRLQDAGTLLPDVCVHELGSSHVVLLFATTTTVFRLMLPHPEAVIKNPTLVAAGDGLQPSILTFASEESLRDPTNTAPVSPLPYSGSPSPLSSCGSWISLSLMTTFALASPLGAIHVVQLPPPGSQGLPLHSELREASVMHRIWSSFVPSSMRGGGELADAPVSVGVHVFSGETIVLALCRDLSLRLWSCQQAQCLMTHRLTDYLPQEDKQPLGRVERLLLRKAPGGTPTSLRFGLYLDIEGLPPQISVFQLLLMDNQLVLNHLSDWRCPEDCNLVEFQPSSQEVWGVWSGRGGEGEETLVQYALYDRDSPGDWQTVSLPPSLPREILIPPHKDPRETYLDELFHPGGFSLLAICKALELYGATSLKETVQELKREAIVRVEQELHSSTASLELRHDEFHELQVKCWAKFYRCCHEYQELLSHPLGVFLDPTTGLTCLLRRGHLSFLQPGGKGEEVMEGSAGVRDPLLEEDLARFVECVKLTANKLGSEVLSSFIADLDYSGDGHPVKLATELAHALVDIPAEDDYGGDFLPELRKSVGAVGDLSAVLGLLERELDPGTRGGEEEGEMEQEDTELQLAVSQLFASHVATAILGASLQESCYRRLQFCRDVIVLLCLVNSEQSTGKQDGQECLSIEKVYLDRFSTLLLSYYALYWLVSRPVLQPSISAFEANMRQLAALEISAGKSSQSSAAASATTLGELYLCSRGRRQLCSSLVSVLPSTSPLHPYWSTTFPHAITTLLAQLWPLTSTIAVCEFLLGNCQYTHLQDYLSLVGSFVTSEPHSRYFLLGRSFLHTGELLKARDCFLTAAKGVDSPSEPLLQRLTSGEGGEEEGGGGGGGGGLAEYYLKLVRLFEQLSSPTLVLDVTKAAISECDTEDANCAILWSTLFKYQLQLGHYHQAYSAMMDNPDPNRRKDCLRRFLVVLTEEGRLKELCAFPYTGLEEEMEKVLEARARSVDIMKHGYYNLLYCFHTARENFRKAAYVMYEYGLRLGREAPGPKSLQKQANSYSMALTALHLVDPKYAWVVRPVELDQVQSQSKRVSRRKRIHPSQQGLAHQKVEVLTIADIEKEYLLIRAKLSLLQKEPSMSTQLSSPFVSAEEVVSLLVQVGLFNRAIDTALRFTIPLTPVFEALAARCVHLSVNIVAFRRGVGDTSTLDWLGLNHATDVPTSRENSLADKAWALLQTHLEKHDPCQHYQLQKCVARKLLSMGAQLPQWMMDKYKCTDPAALLRLYLTFDLLEPATHLALEYIDAVMGHGKEFFGLKTALHASSPSVWLPYSALEHLQLALRGAPAESTLAKLSNELNSKLEHYFHLVAGVSWEMEREAQNRHRQLLSI